MRFPLLVAALLARPAAASAADAPAGPPAIDSGEFRNTAQTTPKGVFLFHPLLKSQFGLADHLDIKVPILGTLLGGPNVSVEYQFVDSDAVGLSIEPQLYLGWTLKNYNAGGTLHSTIAVGANRLNISAGAVYAQTYIKDTDLNTAGDQSVTTKGLTLPINVGFDIVVNDATTLRFVVNTAVPLNGGFGAIGAFNWNHAFGDNFRLSLGVAVLSAGFITVPDQIAGKVPTWAVLPVPTFELWWRF